MRHFPYGLIYGVLDEAVEIIAVAHLHRAPEIGGIGSSRRTNVFNRLADGEIRLLLI